MQERLGRKLKRMLDATLGAFDGRNSKIAMRLTSNEIEKGLAYLASVPQQQ